MPRPPCFVVILSDDQAPCDLGCLGATDLLTPNLDRLAASGAILRSWYSNSPVCSPSRASLLTGRYPGNAGVRSILRGHRTAIGLPADVPTLAGVLRPLGYRTALYGKWHLGVREGSRPHDRGFDEWFGFLAGCVDYYSHIFYFDMDSGRDPTHDLWEDGREVWERRILHEPRHGARGRVHPPRGARRRSVLPLRPVQRAPLPDARTARVPRPLPRPRRRSAHHRGDDRGDGRRRRRDPRRARARRAARGHRGLLPERQRAVARDA